MAIRKTESYQILRYIIKLQLQKRYVWTQNRSVEKVRNQTHTHICKLIYDKGYNNLNFKSLSNDLLNNHLTELWVFI